MRKLTTVIGLVLIVALGLVATVGRPEPARAVMVGPVPPGLARIAWSSSSFQRRTTLSPLLGPRPLLKL